MTVWTARVRRASAARRSLLKFAAASSAIALGAVSVATIPSSAATAPIAGSVFRDLNHDGVNDADDPAWAGVTVTAIAPDGSTASAVSGDDGSYAIADLDDTVTYRVEFSWDEEWLNAAPIGADNGSAVQFVPGGGTANFAVAHSDDFCSPGGAVDFATTCFINGDPLADGSVYADAAAVVHIPETASGAKGETGADPAAPTLVATNTVLGSAYGLAWQPSAERMFAASFLKRHIGLGVGGIDAIYEIDDGVTSVWYTAIDAGTVGSNTDRGLPTEAATPTSLDPTAFGLVGKVGFGDVDMSADESTLYAVNLFDRAIYSIDVAAADGGSTTAHTSLGTPPHTCPDASPPRPFGIEIHEGTLWAAVTCTAEVSGSTADLSTAVYAYDLSEGSWATTPGIDFPLNYTKGCSTFTEGCGFGAWLDVYTDATFGLVPNGSPYEGPTLIQPLVSDLEIDGDGSLIIGIRDRTGDQFGHRNLSPADDGNLVTGLAGGDLLRAAPGTDAGTWVLESNGTVGGITTTATGTGQVGLGGPGTNQGPGGGEFYADDFVTVSGTTWHSETILGGLALPAGRSSVAVTNFDPLNERLDAAGISWFDNTTGRTVNEYELYRDASDPQPTTLGKANGLGDLESLCPAAPLQIGDRVWFDRDGDGVQDGDEPGIPGVKIMISIGDADPITVTTDANGQWSFTAAPFTTYTIMVDPSMADVSGIAEVDDAADLMPTTADSGDADEVDSDMDVDTLKMTAVTAGPSANDHSFDAGFVVEPVTLEIGNLVWLDNDNDGIAEMGEPGIEGVTVELWIDSTDDGVKDTLVDDTVTDADGHYVFSDLEKDTYYLAIPAQWGDGEPLDGLASSVPPFNDANNDDDNDDNGMGPFSADGAVMSGPVALMADTEPDDEVDRDGKTERDVSPSGTADTNSNLSVDFGFYPTAKVGDTVWYDTDNDGEQDPDEAGVPNVTVHLCDAEMNPILTTQTDENGMYMFGDLRPGDYMICFDLETLPDGYSPTINDSGSDDAADSDPNPVTGKTPLIVLDAGDEDLTWDLGIVTPDVSPSPDADPDPDTETPTVDDNGQTPGQDTPTTIARTGTDGTMVLVSAALALLGLGVGLLALVRLRTVRIRTS